MFKLVFGLIIVGLILYVWYQVRKEAVKFKRQQDAQDELSEIQDYEEAAKWLTKAAEQGEEYAQEQLGALYYFGRGVEQSYSDAYVWYLKASMRGSQEADRMIDVMTQNMD